MRGCRWRDSWHGLLDLQVRQKNTRGGSLCELSGVISPCLADPCSAPSVQVPTSSFVLMSRKAYAQRVASEDHTWPSHGILRLQTRRGVCVTQVSSRASSIARIWVAGDEAPRIVARCNVPPFHCAPVGPRAARSVDSFPICLAQGWVLPHSLDTSEGLDLSR